MFDYQMLMHLLRDYAQPRRKLHDLLKSGELIRVRKGLYVFGNERSSQPPSRLSVANLVYGPSYVSLQSALSFHGLIPEGVYETTSVTPKRNKRFNTPLGVFSYRYLRSKLYPVGVTQYYTAQGHGILIASPEKALADMLWLHRSSHKNQPLKELLFEDLRVDPDKLRRMDRGRLSLIGKRFLHSPISELHALVSELNNE